MNSEDKKLLELAAKAVGFEISCVNDTLYVVDRFPNGQLAKMVPWNPLEDGNDALKIASKLGIDISFSLGFGFVVAGSIVRGPEEDTNPDPFLATCRVIVRAAAEIGADNE